MVDKGTETSTILTRQQDFLYKLSLVVRINLRSSTQYGVYCRVELSIVVRYRTDPEADGLTVKTALYIGCVDHDIQ